MRWGYVMGAQISSGVRVSWGESLEDVGPIESLEAEIEQADRYLKLSYES